MKRLLIAMAAVVGALGFFSAQASDTTLSSGTGFDDLSVGDLDTQTKNNYWSSWSTGDASSEWLKVTAWDGSGKTYAGTRPAVPGQTETEQKNYLDVKTSFTNGVERYINSDGSVYTMDGDVFVDTLVKFTTADEELEVPDGTKLAIYLKEITEADGDEIISTNLIVRAGAYGDDGVTLSPCSYDCGKFANPDDWHRLTVRAIKGAYSNTSIGFVIFIDSTVLVKFSKDQSSGYKSDRLSNEAKAFDIQRGLFPSLIDGGSNNGQMLTGIGLAGSGAIDDIVFQSETPAGIAVDNVVTLKWDEHVTSVSYSVNGAAATSVGDDDLGDGFCVIKYEKNGMTVAVTAEYETGYAAGAWTNGTDATLSATTFVFSGSGGDAWAQIVSKYVRDDYSVTINGETVKYSLIDDVLEAINNDDVTSATITLLNDVTIGRETVVEGQESYVRPKARFENKDVTIDLNGKTISGPTDNAAKADETPLYVICVTGGSLTIKDSSDNASGKIVAKSAPGVVWVESAEVESAEDATAATLAISGGTFDGLVGFDAVGDSVFNILPVTCSLTGGNYLASENTKEDGSFALTCADGYVAEKQTIDETEYWVVAKSTTVATVNGTGYKTLQDAIDAAILLAKGETDGDDTATSGDDATTETTPVTVEICSDITLTETLVIASDDAEKVAFTINTPEGYTVTSAPTNGSDPGVTIDGVTITFTGDGTWQKTSGSKTFICVGETLINDTYAAANVTVKSGKFMAEGAHIFNVQNGTITVDGGEFAVSKQNDKNNRYCIRAECSEVKDSTGTFVGIGGTVIVNGGTFTMLEAAIVPAVGWTNSTENVAGTAAAYIPTNSVARFSGAETVIRGELEDCLAESNGQGGYDYIEYDWKFKKQGTDEYYTIAAVVWATVTVTWDTQVTGWSGTDDDGTFPDDDDDDEFDIKSGSYVNQYDVDDKVTCKITKDTIKFEEGYELDEDKSTLELVDSMTDSTAEYKLHIAAKPTQAVTPLDPTDANGTTYDSAEDATKAAEEFNEALKTNPELIEVPDVVTSDDDKKAYRALFQAVAEGTTVKLDFTPTAKEDLATAAETAVESIELQTFAASDGTAAQNLLTVKKAIPGLWYTLLQGTDTPANLPTAHSQQAETSEVKFNVTKDADTDRAFFRMKITTTEVKSTGLTN